MLDTLSLSLGVILGLAWWNILLIVGTSIIFTACVFYEEFGASLFFLATTITILAIFGVIDYTAINYLAVLQYIFFYLLVGIMWSLIKYKIETDKIIEDCRGVKTQKEILSLIKSRLSINQISFWIIFFPVSVIKFATEDLIHYIVLKLSSVYELIAKYSLRNIQ